MSVWIGSCPHCRASHMTFPVLRVEALNDWSANIFFSCPGCRGPSAARIARNASSPTSLIANLESSWPRSLGEAGYVVQQLFPAAAATLAPDSVPSAVERNFVQAEEARLRDHREAAGMAYRRSLELALKDIDPDLKGTLEKRIDKFAEGGRLTADLAEWAHSVRELGNEATHDTPEPTKDDVEDLASFTRVVLEYLYTMPAKVRARAANPGIEDAVQA